MGPCPYGGRCDGPWTVGLNVNFCIYILPHTSTHFIQARTGQRVFLFCCGPCEWAITLGHSGLTLHDYITQVRSLAVDCAFPLHDRSVSGVFTLYRSPSVDMVSALVHLQTTILSKTHSSSHEYNWRTQGSNCISAIWQKRNATYLSVPFSAINLCFPFTVVSLMCVRCCEVMFLLFV